MQPPVQPSAAAIEAIAQALVDVVGTQNATILLYAELDDGWVGSSIDFVPSGTARVQQLRQGNFIPISMALMNAWDEARTQLDSGVWTTMIVVLNDGRVSVRLLYADQIDPNVDWEARADAERAKTFPGLSVDPAA